MNTEDVRLMRLILTKDMNMKKVCVKMLPKYFGI